MDDFERELKIGFLDEASQSLTDVEQCFLSLESNPNDSDNLNKIFRLAHNLKGSSKAVGFLDMGAFTHEFETFILKIKNGELAATPAVVSLLLQCNDHLIQMVDGLKQNLDAKFDSSTLLNEMSLLKDNPSESSAPVEETTEIETPSAPEETEIVATTPSEESDVNDEIERLLASNNFSESPAPPPTAANIVPDVPAALASAASPTAPTNNLKPSGSAVAEETLRVSVGKLEKLLNTIGEMVILQSVLREQTAQDTALPLKKTVHQLGKVGKEIQDLSMSLRMVPIKPTFQKMQRIVRDTAQAVNKEVGISLLGEETELDKTVLEKINDPLVHLIRNSVDHGIEKSEIRTAAGKTLKGNVTLSAQHQSGKLIIEVKDDGGGLDTEKLKKKAIEKGILKPNTTLTEKEAFNLIFAPGFSTKEQVTDVSGRGVGMDVVRTNIQELSGDIQIDSVLGKGTTFRIQLPLTLAIIDAMICIYNNEKFVIPLSQVHETLKPNSQQIQNILGQKEALLLRGENLPLFRLGDFFGRATTLNNNEMIAMVIRTGAQPFALLVDDILGQYQVVVKQLGPELQGTKGISGTTILGDGKPALILDCQDLLSRKNTRVPNVQIKKDANMKTSVAEQAGEGAA